MPDDTNEDVNERFFAIANDLAAQEANEYLDSRLSIIDEWVRRREATGQPADLRSLIQQVLMEPNSRGPVIVTMCAALWRLREERRVADGDQ